MRRNTYSVYNNKSDEIKILTEDLVLRICSDGRIQVIDHGEIHYKGYKVDVVAYDLQNNMKIIGEDSRNLDHLLKSLQRLKSERIPKIGFHYIQRHAYPPTLLDLKIIQDEALTRKMGLPVLRIISKICDGVVRRVGLQIGRDYF